MKETSVWIWYEIIFIYNYYEGSNTQEMNSNAALYAPLLEMSNTSTLVNSSREINDVLIWQGDMILSTETILKYYDFNFTGGDEILRGLLGDNETTTIYEKHKAAPSSLSVKLWTDHTIYYSFVPPFPNDRRKEVRRAMDTWESRTCLRFLPVAHSNGDYIAIQDDGPGTPCMSQVGRVEGKQIMNLASHCSYGLMLHELGHAIGFWHEHGRPDRDNYIILLRFLFPKINEYFVDTQGSSYDYRSVMHYPEDYGNNIDCPGGNCKSIGITNVTEYKRQGSPRLGYFSLSEEDTKQANRMYSCPQKGIRGFLTFQVKYGHSISVPWRNWKPDLILTIVDYAGQNHIKRTSRILETSNHNPIVWNELILVGYNEWQFFRMRLWDSDTDSIVTVSATTLVSGGSHRNLKHCENLECRGYIIYDYYLDTRTISGGELVVHVHYAKSLSLPSRSGNIAGPYVNIEGVLSNGDIRTSTTKTIQNHMSPMWEERISVGCGLWNSFFLQIMGERVGRDVKMSDREWVWAYSGFHANQRHNAHREGYLVYSYDLNTNAQGCTSD